MVTSGTNPGSDRRKKQIDAVRLQLSSQRPSEIRRGFEQVRQWLNEESEDRDVYSMLLDVVEKNHELRQQVRDLLIDMTQKESRMAAEAVTLLPSSVDDLLADADDAFYAAEYERSIQLYRQVLIQDPENSRAKNHLTEAQKESHLAEARTRPTANQTNPELPRDAIQYYRKARSYIAARDFSTAMKMLGAAVESAQVRGIKFTEAEKLLQSVQDSSLAQEVKRNIYELAMGKGQWKEAFNVCTDALLPDMTDEGIKNEFDAILKLLREELALEKRGSLKVFAPLDKLRKAYKFAKEILAPKDALLQYVRRQLSGFQTLRTTLVVAVLLVGVGFFRPWTYLPQTPPPTGTPTIALTTAVPPTHTATETALITPTESVPPSETPVVDTPTPAPTETFTPSPTLAPIGYGEITLFIFPLKIPNGGRINHSLKPGQVVPLWEKDDTAPGGPWYRCTWIDVDGTPYEGWIPASSLQIVPGP